jgi:hypothetical protein
LTCDFWAKNAKNSYWRRQRQIISHFSFGLRSNLRQSERALGWWVSLHACSKALAHVGDCPFIVKWITSGLPVIRSGSSAFCQSVCSRIKRTCIGRRHRVCYLGDVWEVDGWKTHFWQCSAANSPTSCLEQFSCSSDWQLAPLLLPSAGEGAYASLSG